MNKKEGVFSPQKSNNKYPQSPPAQLMYSTTLLFGFFFSLLISFLLPSFHLYTPSPLQTFLISPPPVLLMLRGSFVYVYFLCHALPPLLITQFSFLFFPFPLYSSTVLHRYPGRQIMAVSGILWLRAALVQDT